MQAIHKCAVCERQIEPYQETYNHLVIDETRSADICQECIRKVVKLHQKNTATLFPTKTAKKFLNR
ncbi:MAG: hypothetical protein GX654_04940 [Desulfatiglans sp.]|nr:hypothetical protein [Desulfatiglans sp.]